MIFQVCEREREFMFLFCFHVDEHSVSLAAFPHSISVNVNKNYAQKQSLYYVHVLVNKQKYYLGLKRNESDLFGHLERHFGCLTLNLSPLSLFPL